MNRKPPVIERARLAWDYFRHGTARRFPSRTPAPSRKQVPFIWPEWKLGEAQWQLVDLQSYIQEGFDLNTLIYSAMMYKFRAVAAAPLRSYVGDPDHPDPAPVDAPLAKLLDRPNPHMSKAGFVGLCDIYLNISGYAPVWIIRKQRDSLVEASLYPVRPDRVYIVPQPDRRSIMGYLYVPDGKDARSGVPILPQDMMFPKLPNPGDDLDGLGYGLSPFSPLAHSADVDNMVTKFLKLFFERGTMLTGVLKFDVPLDDDTIAQVKDRWKEMYGGYENWDEIGVLDQGGEYQRLGMTFEEFGFEAIDERNESRILGPFGVPPQLVNARLGMKHSTYNNWEEARKAFWEDTMVAELGIFEDEFSYYLQEGDEFAKFDLSKVPALQRNIPALVTAWKDLVTNGVPKNTAAELLGLDLGELPDGDVVYMPISLVPVGRVGGARPEPQDDDNEGAAEAGEENRSEDKAFTGDWPKANSQKGWSSEQKAALWKRSDRTARSWEERFAEAAREQFESDKREILALLSQEKGLALEAKRTVDWSKISAGAAAFYKKQSKTNWRKAFLPLIRGVVEDAAKDWAVELGMAFDVRNLMGEKFLREYVLNFADPISQTSVETVRDILSQAQAEGWSIPQGQSSLETLFRQWTHGDVSSEDWDFATSRLPAYRTEMIMRTETIRSYAAGSEAIYAEAGVEEHEWLATQDDRVRDSHAQADGQVKPIDEPFDVGGYKMLYPGDASLGASPDEFVNCRCTTIPALPE